MNFRAGNRDEPEINLIPFIDILLVVLIFLMLTTTYSRFTELQVNLPLADAQTQQERSHEITVAISNNGRYAINQVLVDGGGVDRLTRAIQQTLLETQGNPETTVIISADAATTHQSVINVMDAARRAGLVKIHFATQQPTSPQSDQP